jgi:hypothetical protein
MDRKQKENLLERLGFNVVPEGQTPPTVIKVFLTNPRTNRRTAININTNVVEYKEQIQDKLQFADNIDEVNRSIFGDTDIPPDVDLGDYLYQGLLAKFNEPADAEPDAKHTDLNNNNSNNEDPRKNKKNGRRFTPKKIKEWRPRARVTTDKELPDLLETDKETKEDQERFKHFQDGMAENENMSKDNDLHAINVAEIDMRFKNPVALTTNGFEDTESQYDYEMSKHKHSRRRVRFLSKPIIFDKLHYERDVHPILKDLTPLNISGNTLEFKDTILSIHNPTFD